MLKYAKIIDEATGIVEIGTGDPDAVYQVLIDGETGEEKTIYVREFYESLGMKEMDVEQAANGSWYLAGKVPLPPQTKEVRTFSKFGIWVATQDMPLTLPDGTSSNLWAEFEKFMRNTKLEKGETLYSGWKNLNDLVEDNQFFQDFYPLAVETFGKELVDNVLAASVVGTKTVIVEG